MIYHCIRYTIDRHKLADFEAYARRWMEGDILRRCGAKPLGYFLPKKGLGGADNIAIALLGFESLAHYEQYRARLSDDPDSREFGGGRKLAVYFSRRAIVFLSH
jgi:hypothetical protein